MTDLHSPMILHHHSPIHVVVPLRPGADLDLVRAKLSGAFAQHDHPVVWHIPRERVTSFLADHAAEAARDNAGLLVAAGMAPSTRWPQPPCVPVCPWGGAHGHFQLFQPRARLGAGR